ncbi:hypothetical protein DFJ77DRAFT_548918 [Powellomyces hirtus]|nr:hypothetical protein DFJ77DRAFT_548918 [Powellomyces hirtus]
MSKKRSPFDVKSATARPISVATELLQTKNQISTFRENIEHLETTFREHVIFKRGHFQPYAIFSADIPVNSMTDDEGYATEMIARAKDDLLRQSGQKKKLEEEHANQKLDSEEYLRNRIKETREKFRAKETLLEAGPKFVHYFCCTYGEVMFVHFLGARLYVVFASNNWLEFWEFPPASESPQLRDVVQLSTIDMIATVCHLFSDERLPDDSQAGEEDDDNESSSRRSSMIMSSSDIPSRRLSATSSIASQDNLQPAQAKSLWGSAAAEPSKRRISARTRVIGNVAEEEEIEAVQEEDDPMFAAPLRPASGRTRKDSTTIQELVPPAPIVVTQHTFFLGCVSGAGSTFVIDVTYVRDTDVSTYVYSICNTRQLSLIPIKLSCFVEYDDSIVCLVSHTGTDLVLAAYGLDLEDIWQCKGDVLRYTAKDKQLKVIAQTRLDVVRERSKHGDERPHSSLDESFISAITADLIQKHLLVAMRSGAILRLNCETVVVGGNKEKDPKETSERDPLARRPTLTADTMPPVMRKDLFVAWCLETQPLPSKSLAPSRHVAKGAEEALGKAPGKAVYSFRTGPEIMARHMTTFFHAASNKPYLLLCCTDGSLRMYLMDMGLATAVPIVYTYTDQDREQVPSSDQALVWADSVRLVSSHGALKQFLVAYTADGIFVIYNILSPTPLLEKRILSNRAATLFRDPIVSSSSDQLSNAGSAGSINNLLSPSRLPTTAGPPPPPSIRKCRMLNSENGTCVITAGREWGLIDMKNLQKWDIRDVANGAGEKG